MDSFVFEEDKHEKANFATGLLPRIIAQEDRRIAHLKNDKDELLEVSRAVDEFESSQSEPVQLPDLIIKQGESRSIPQRTHLYNEVRIESGGKLNLIGSAQQWCIIDCRGDFICNGDIYSTGTPYGSDPIEATAPDGQYLSHSYPSSARGGRGGKGGNAHTNTRNSGPATAEGGGGARGTEKYGGGGGGGAGGPFCQICRRAYAYPGQGAVDEIGGLAGQYGSGDGGDGGRSTRYRNGPLLYIHSRKFDGKGGHINLNARNGAGGVNGADGGFDDYSNSRTGGGGGGGGAPGGDGGVLVVKCKELVKEPRVSVSPGRGGTGGTGGGRGLRGSDGQRGDDGSGGYVDWIIRGKLAIGSAEE